VGLVPQEQHQEEGVQQGLPAQLHPIQQSWLAERSHAPPGIFFAIPYFYSFWMRALVRTQELLEHLQHVEQLRLFELLQ